MSKKTYHVTMTAVLSIEDGVIDECMSEEFAEYITRFSSRNEAVSFLAYNMVRNGLDVNQIDGLAGRKPGIEEARVVSVSVDDVTEV